MKQHIKKKTIDDSVRFSSDIEESLKALEGKLSEKFPAGVPRNKIGEATGHVLHPRTCANEDSLGNGIPGRFKIGRNMIYPVLGVMLIIRSKIRV